MKTPREKPTAGVRLRGLLLLVCGALLAAGGGARAEEGAADAAGGEWVADGARAVLDLAGTWQAAPAGLDLQAVPAAGWSAHAVPHGETKLIDANDIGPYFPAVEKVVDANGDPVRSDRLAAWFRREFVVPADGLAGKRILLQCDGVAYKSRIFLNDALAGESVLGTAPAVYDVTALVRPGRNALRIGAAGRAALYDREHRTFVAPVAGVMPGIWGGVRLEAVPLARIDEVFLRTELSRKKFAAEVTLCNAGAAPRTVTVDLVAQSPQGVAELRLRSAAVTLAAGQTGVVTLEAPWVAKHLWSPGTPELYLAKVALLEGEQTVDRTEQSFGYREFTARGRDFLLNGRRQVLLRSSWLTGPAAGAEQVMPNLTGDLTQFNCLRLHLNFLNPHVMRQSDRTGMLVIPEFWGFYQNNDKAFPAAASAYWADNAAEMMRRVVRRYRNHPSVILWSLTNETFWDSTDPAHMAVADKLAKAVRAADPTRLLQGDAEITWDNRLDVLNIHYPEGEAGTVGRQFENSGWVIPNDFAWLSREGRNQGWRADFRWDRPLAVGEYYCQDGDEPERYAPYCGNEAYDLTKWRWQAMNGRDAILPRPDNGWIRMVKMSTDHYRAAGVAALNPWTGTGLQLMPRLLIAPLDYFPNAFGGEPYVRRIVIANDGTQAWYRMHVQAGLLVDGREVWGEPMIPAQAEPGEGKTIAVTAMPPVVGKKTPARLVLRLCCLRGPRPQELARHEEEVTISPHFRLAGQDASAVALIDAPGHATAGALAKMGLPVQPVAAENAAWSGKRLLIIGEGAAGQADAAAVARFVESGGQLLVLHQTQLPLWLPDQPSLDAKHAATFSWKLSPHPALAGLADADLRFWRPDHLVSTHTLLRPVAGAGAAQTVCGGRFGMQWSPLVTLRHGRGEATFCQYLLTSRIGVEPAAEELLAGLVAQGLRSRARNPQPPLRLLGRIPAETLAVLREANVLTSEGPEGDGPALLDAAAAPDAATLRRLRAEVEAGRTLWVRNLNERTLPAVAALLPWQPGFAPLTPTVGLMRRGTHALAAGLGHAEFYWARGPDGGKPTAALGGPVLVPPALDAADLLTEPALLVAVPLGKGAILLDQLAWDGALAAETTRVLRIVSALARNAGAGFSPPVSAEQQYRFTALDLRPYANRGYHDETAGDGKGGWTDQGENDMRYFLINHTGMVGGMAVTAEKFPAEARFGGIPYRLIDPRQNAGRAVLTLRGGEHDPAAPATVGGIVAGNVRASKVWFLHAACWSSEGGHGVEVARYAVTYADGSRVEIPVRQGIEVFDWWHPKPLAGAAVAWTGRNAKTAPIGIYAMPWTNPSPEKPLAALEVVGSLVQTQLVLLAVTFGTEKGPREVAAWDAAQYAEGKILPAAGTVALTGAGVPESVGGRRGVRLQGGAALQAELIEGPVAQGKPFAVSVELAPLGTPEGYFGGIVEAAAYLQAGFRILLNQQNKVVVEQFGGKGQDHAVYLTSRESLPSGRYSTVRYEHDGTRARLMIDGKLQEMKACALPAAYRGGWRIGVAGGKQYYLNAVLRNLRVYDLGAP